MSRCVAALALAALPAAGAKKKQAASPPKPTRIYSFGSFDKEMLAHPDPDVRQAVRAVEFSSARHQGCMVTWYQTPNHPESAFGVWEPASFAHGIAASCVQQGGRPLSLRPAGNDTTVFPSEVFLCLPPVCDPGFVREHWLPRVFLGRLLLMPGRGKVSLAALRRELRKAGVRLQPVVDFPRPDLPSPKVVIAGFPYSGTTSMVTELNRHPQVAFPEHEDQIFWSFVYTKRNVANWRRDYARAAAKKLAAMPPNATRPVLLGVKDPFLVLCEGAFKAAARTEGLKVLVLLRDPLHLIQTWLNHGGDWINPFGDPMSFYVGLYYRFIFFTILFTLPPQQLLAVPTVGLAKAPLLVYQRVVRFLGLPERTRQPFRTRENRLVSASACVTVGSCFDWCTGPPELLPTMHALVRLEARAAERLLASWPPGMRQLLPSIPERCPRWTTPTTAPAHWAETDPGLCWALHYSNSSCFADRAACAACCEHHTSCRLYSPEFTQCCMPLETVLADRARALLRKHLCGSPDWPCTKGFGRQRTASVP